MATSTLVDVLVYFYLQEKVCKRRKKSEGESSQKNLPSDELPASSKMPTSTGRKQNVKEVQRRTLKRRRDQSSDTTDKQGNETLEAAAFTQKQDEKKSQVKEGSQKREHAQSSDTIEKQENDKLEAGSAQKQDEKKSRVQQSNQTDQEVPRKISFKKSQSETLVGLLSEDLSDQGEPITSKESQIIPNDNCPPQLSARRRDSKMTGNLLPDTNGVSMVVKPHNESSIHGECRPNSHSNWSKTDRSLLSKEDSKKEALNPTSSWQKVAKTVPDPLQLDEPVEKSDDNTRVVSECSNYSEVCDQNKDDLLHCDRKDVTRSMISPGALINQTVPESLYMTGTPKHQAVEKRGNAPNTGYSGFTLSSHATGTASVKAGNLGSLCTITQQRHNNTSTNDQPDTLLPSSFRETKSRSGVDISPTVSLSGKTNDQLKQNVCNEHEMIKDKVYPSIESSLLTQTPKSSSQTPKSSSNSQSSCLSALLSAEEEPTSSHRPMVGNVDGSFTLTTRLRRRSGDSWANKYSKDYVLTPLMKKTKDHISPPGKVEVQQSPDSPNETDSCPGHVSLNPGLIKCTERPGFEIYVPYSADNGTLNNSGEQGKPIISTGPGDPHIANGPRNEHLNLTEVPIGQNELGRKKYYTAKKRKKKRKSAGHRKSNLPPRANSGGNHMERAESLVSGITVQDLGGNLQRIESPVNTGDVSTAVHYAVTTPLLCTAATPAASAGPSPTTEQHERPACSTPTNGCDDGTPYSTRSIPLTDT